MNKLYTEYLTKVGHALEQHSHWRVGQTYFNVLHQLHPDIADEIRGTKIDPFYRAAVIDDKFLEVVEEALERKAHEND
jgi:hypothetical protein